VFKYQLLGADIYVPMAELGSRFPAHLGKVLSLAQTSFLTVLPPEKLQAVAQFMHPDTTDHGAGVFKGMIHYALKTAGVDQFEITFIAPEVQDPDDVDQLSLGMLRIDILEARREVRIDCSGRRMVLNLEPRMNKAVLKPLGSAAYAPIPMHRAGKYVSLEFAIFLASDQKGFQRKLFPQLVKMRTDTDMCPFNILVSHGQVFTSSLLKTSAKLLQYQAKTAGPDNTIAQTDTQVAALSSAIESPFSLMEHSSGAGNLSMALARAFPDDTIISTESDRKLSDGHWQHIANNAGPFNNVVCQIEPDTNLLNKLLESPEVLRYQYLSWRYIKKFIQDREKAKAFGSRLGTAFATGVTTFLEVPSTRSISIAAAIAFPELVATQDRSKILGPTAMAVAGLADLEMRFTLELTRISGATQAVGYYNQGASVPGAEGAATLNNVSVTPSIVPPVAVNGTFPSWRLLRIDVKKLTLQVNHHFDYIKDGHARKYQQHIESTSSKDWSVYLTRKKDNWRIPYEEIKSITLIALLRMGLHPSIKSRFYGQFLRLPFYEDMAPWNIVFQGGVLAYIDYDTKDNPLTDVLPYAYQITAALMNYERTVADFGHCPGHANNEFGVAWVSHCVRSQFNGPCPESRYPIPCGDESCRESFPACLLAIRKLEYDAKHANPNSPDVVARLIAEGGEEPEIDGAAAQKHVAKAPVSWVYDRNGHVDPHNVQK